MYMKLKAQSAMEYLMTYGWAILIVIIVAAALYALGIFNPATFTGQRATGFPNIGTPVDWLYTSSGELNITIKNGLGESITISSVTANCGNQQASVTLENASNPTVGAGKTAEYFTGTTNCQQLASGSSYSIQVTVNYIPQSGTYNRRDSGTITGVVV